MLRIVFRIRWFIIVLKCNNTKNYGSILNGSEVLWVTNITLLQNCKSLYDPVSLSGFLILYYLYLLTFIHNFLLNIRCNIWRENWKLQGEDLISSDSQMNKLFNIGLMVLQLWIYLIPINSIILWFLKEKKLVV